MKAKIVAHRIGKFNLPRVAHVVNIEVQLEPDEMLGMLLLRDADLMLRPASEEAIEARPSILSNGCPCDILEVVDEEAVKRHVRNVAELGDVLHVQLSVGHEKMHTFHVFHPVDKGFLPSDLSVYLMKKVETVDLARDGG